MSSLIHIKHIRLYMFLEFLCNSVSHYAHNCSETSSHLFNCRLNFDILLGTFSHLFFFKIVLTEMISTNRFKNNLSLVVVLLHSNHIKYLPLGPVNLGMDSILRAFCDKVSYCFI